ncbi:ras-related protein Rab-18-like [Branchiostoma floridae x Branchiostoma japonicum]
MAVKRPTFKLVLLGEVGVGKTSLFVRLKDDTFLEDTKASIGVDFCETLVKVGGEEVRLCIWDTAGVERFRTMTQGYYRHADAALLVYSLTDSASLRLLTSWAREVNDRTVTSNSPVLKIIVGNKSDLEHRTTERTAAELAATYGCELVLQVSAKTGEGIDEAVQVIAGKLLARSRERRRSHLTSPDSDGNPLTLDRQDTKERRQTARCC